jgi:DNA polymerase
MNISKYMVFGQNPGYNECIKDEPFVGDAGKTFDKEIEKHGLSRSDFYISNVLHCYTPGNRKPSSEELTACRPLIQQEILLMRPRLIITLGKFAFNTLCPSDKYGASLGKIKKSSFAGESLNVFPIYHPSGMNLAVKARREKFETDITLMCKLINRWPK